MTSGRKATLGRRGHDLRRDLRVGRLFARALATGVVPVEVTTDRAPAYPRVLD